MEFALSIILFIFFGALICEFIDSALGMLYGTILSPVLIIAGFNPVLVIPAILFSQAIGGLTASVFHHRKKNVDFSFKSNNPKYIVERLKDLGYKETFNRGTTKDFKVSFCIFSLGIIATIFAAFIAINISKEVLKTYIGILVLLMGVIVLSGISFKFSWKKIIGIGILSAFNKGLSGGGFGPIVTAGQIIGGRNGKNSIGATTLAEAPICIAGFLTYFFTRGILNWNFILILTGGALAGAIIGPQFTARFKSEKKLKLILGILVLILGIWTLADTWFL